MQTVAVAVLVTVVGAPICAPAFGSGQLPQSIAAALRELRTVDAGDYAERLARLRSAEAECAPELAQRLVDPATRAELLAEIERHDPDEAAHLRAALPAGALSAGQARELLAPYVARHVTVPLDAALVQHQDELRRDYQRQLRVVLGVMPPDSPSARADKLEQIERWEAARAAAHAAVHDETRYSEEDRGASGQAEVDVLVRAVWVEHLRLQKTAEKDVRKLLARSPVEWTQLLSRMDAICAAWVSTAAHLAERCVLGFQPLDADGDASSACRALVELHVGGRARHEDSALDPYRDMLLRFAHAERVRRMNRDAEKALRLGDVETDLVRRINDYRLAMALPMLELEPHLVACARGHSAEMQERGYLAHESPVPERHTIARRALLAGYPSEHVGECIFQGKPEGEAVFLWWYRSPVHHRILLRADLRQIGVGSAGPYATANFGLLHALAYGATR